MIKTIALINQKGWTGVLMAGKKAKKE